LLPVPAPLLPQPAASRKVTMIPLPIRAFILIVSSVEDYGAARQTIRRNAARAAGENKTATFSGLARMGGMPPNSRPPPGAGDPVANEAMDRYADGDASAFPVLYDAIAPRIEGLVRRRTRDASRIDDIVQQTFERIHRARGTFIRGSDVLSWAFKIARNLCLDFGARGWRERPADGKAGEAGEAGEVGADPIAQAVAEVVDAERIATARETLERLVRAFRALPERQQLALELVRVEGFPMAAAAENLGVTLASIKMSVFRGAEALRNAVREDAAPRGARGTAAQPPPVGREHLRGIT
jgi:RNA polymerase sigma-70 factor (ECF subfamily)